MTCQRVLMNTHMTHSLEKLRNKSKFSVHNNVYGKRRMSHEQDTATIRMLCWAPKTDESSPKL